MEIVDLLKQPTHERGQSAKLGDRYLQLLSATAQGDRSAFERLYKLTSSKLYAVSLQMLKRKDLAEEALQEAYVRVWHNASEYNYQRGPVLTWMISIVRYRALDMLRAAKVRGENSSDEIDAMPISSSAHDRPDVELMHRRERVRIDKCMDQLEKNQADAIALAYFRGFTHDEVCFHMNLPLGSIKSWIRRGLQRLRRCLES